MNMYLQKPHSLPLPFKLHMNSLGDPYSKLQEHRIANKTSFHPNTSRRNTQSSLFNEKTSVCHNALKLKRYLYGKNYNW